MSPILGIYASQISGHLWEPAGAYDALWSTTLTASSSSIDISGIPGEYKHLQIRASWVKSAQADIYMRFNSDTGTNYSYHVVRGQGTSGVSAYGYATQSQMAIQWNGSPDTNTPAVFIQDILDYSNTNKFKTIRTLAGFDNNTDGEVDFFSGNWRNTNAVNSISIYPASGSFAQYSSFALYGVK